MRRVISILLAVCFVAPLLSTSVGRADDTEAQKAAKEIADARERANAAADAYFASESRIDRGSPWRRTNCSPRSPRWKAT